MNRREMLGTMVALPVAAILPPATLPVAMDPEGEYDLPSDVVDGYAGCETDHPRHYRCCTCVLGGHYVSCEVPDDSKYCRFRKLPQA
jgi:hypothetical protein